MHTTPNEPAVLTRLSDPRPALLLGTVAWLVACVVVLVTDGAGSTLAVCACGAAIGVLGYALFFVQRRAARRGDRGAQQGLV
ncbi:DUF2530 domain-containing protein [Rhodococcus sp. HNM0569]|uniref:DUF2530 domain-containing protein n=1 Tax=Rhodococcus sp. HNM0569 TaxID=2716340 RepID=UPI00146E6D5E|nr:DUF2530 domain-containing protein [Rhodococcus sp. HNM0569]